MECIIQTGLSKQSYSLILYQERKAAMENVSTLLRHIVIFKYKDGATRDQIEQVTAAFRALQHKIPGIRSFEQGTNNSPEGKNLGFMHVFTLTFEDAQARDAYLPHPEHQQFGALLAELDIVVDVFVIDYFPAV
jgi:hypothetical protein